ncbi:hypothetical protein SLEP1_g60078 [Rubroshorea leprosula]|uniref:Uncharacterized protein n=1 Tax=Rubroshorea leprosula TaxID=152421 RepID=A0AAV5MVG5_9ROSI|nr:hypothetical protein SLEP1_g60078 [Rubroshorea leprosula]
MPGCADQFGWVGEKVEQLKEGNKWLVVGICSWIEYERNEEEQTTYGMAERKIWCPIERW